MTQRIDVIIPSYNDGHRLDQCLAAVSGQTRTDFAVLVIDDASDDDTTEIIQRWAQRDPRVRGLRNDVHLGHVASLKKAYSLGSADYVVVLSADNLWAPTLLEKTAGALDAHPGCSYAYAGWATRREATEGAPEQDSAAWIPHTRGGIVNDTTYLTIQNWIPLSMGVFRRADCDRAGGLSPEDLQHCGDHWHWLRLSAVGHSFYVNEQLGKIRPPEAHQATPTVPEDRRAFESIHLLDLVYQSDRWSPAVRLLAKASQYRLLTAAPLTEAVQRFGNPQTDPVIRHYFERTWKEFRIEVARCIFGFLPITDALGGPEDAVGLLKEVLRDDPDHRDAKTLLESVRHLVEADYQTWIRNHALNEIDGELLAERMLLKWPYQPVFHLIAWMWPEDQALLADTLDNLSQQLYPNWRLTVVSPIAMPDPMFAEINVLRWIQAAPEHRLTALNQAVSEVEADWFAFVPAGFRMEPQALVRLGNYVHLKPQWTLIYTDDDQMGPEGTRHSPRFKPEMNLDMLRSTYYMGPAFASRKALGKQPAFQIGGAEAYDLALRLLDAHGEAGIGHISDVLCHLPEGFSDTIDAPGLEALSRHLSRRGIAGEAMPGYLPGTYRVAYRHATSASVTIVIPNKDKPEFLVPCVESLFAKTDYPAFDLIIVDNGSTDPDVFEFYRRLQEERGQQVAILDYPHPFNYSAICNTAARQAKGEYILFLNNDTAVLHPEWLARMMAHAQRPEVGIVGARLVFPETGRLQHAGVIVGHDGVADHHFLGALELSDPGYMGRAQIEQNYSAVTGACQLVRKSLYETVGGQDDVDLPVSYNDIDLCLKVIAQGYKVVWTPFATLVHHGSVTQKGEEIDLERAAKRHVRFKAEREKMLERWLPVLANDPAYNQNLSLVKREMQVEAAVPINWDLNFHDRPRILGLPLQGGSGDYRMIHPFGALSRAGIAQCEYIRFGKNEGRPISVTEMARLAPDALVMHAALHDVEILALESYRRFLPRMKRIYMLDDLVTQVPEKSSVYKSFMGAFRDAKARLRKSLAQSDRLIVSTAPLAELCKDMVSDIRVIPNRLQRDIWVPLQSLRRQGKKPRVGWAGAQQHAGDLALIGPVVKALADKVEWVFFGMAPENCAPYIKELHGFVPITQYPAKLASLNLDLAIAPLEQNAFNEAKSNLRLLEYGIFGWPVVCTDITPYQAYDAPVTRVENTPEAWIAALQAKLANPEETAREGDRLRAWVLKHFILEDHLKEWASGLLD